VRSPEQTAFMANAVEPVVSKVFGEKQNCPGPPLISDLENGKAVNGRVCTEDERFAHNTKQHVSQTHAEAGGGVFELVEIAAHRGVENDFQQQKGDEAGDRQIDEIGNLRHVFYYKVMRAV